MVSFIAWNNVQMKVVHSLPGNASAVSSDVIAVGFMFIFQIFFRKMNYVVQPAKLFCIQVKDCFSVSFTDNQNVSRLDWQGIIYGNKTVILQDDFIILQGAKDTRHKRIRTALTF